MNRTHAIGPIALLTALAVCPVLAGFGVHQPPAAPPSTPPAVAQAAWRDSFTVDKSKLSPTGRGKYWILEAGHKDVYKSEDEETLTITALNETKVVDGVTTRVVEEREEKKGVLTEVSLNYMAIDPATGDVYYFGEESHTYKDGKIAGNGGSWLAGEKGAKFGMLVCGSGGKVGDRFQQEFAPDVAMDRVEVVSLDERVEVAAGVFEHCLHVVETTPLENDTTNKWYAPGVGLVKDDEFMLATPAVPPQTAPPAQAPTVPPKP